MIEVNRSLYADPNGFTRVQSDLSHAISQATANHSPTADVPFMANQFTGAMTDD